MTNPISMRARVGIGVLLAHGGTAWLHVLNAAGATAEARTWGGSALSFLRDGTLSLLLVLSAVLFALAMTNRLRPATRVTSVPRATVAAVGVTAVMFMSGAIGHAVVLSSEHVPTAQGAAGDTASTVVRVGANPLGAAPVAKVPTGTKPGYQPHQASSPAMTASMGLTPTPADPTNPTPPTTAPPLRTLPASHTPSASSRSTWSTAWSCGTRPGTSSRTQRGRAGRHRSPGDQLPDGALCPTPGEGSRVGQRHVIGRARRPGDPGDAGLCRGRDAHPARLWGDRDRAHTFTLNGHSWRDQNRYPQSVVRSTQGGLLTGSVFNLNLVGGAGGRQALPGDYLYRDGNLNNQVNQGLWGIFRVVGTPKADLKPLQ